MTVEKERRPGPYSQLLNPTPLCSETGISCPECLEAAAALRSVEFPSSCHVSRAADETAVALMRNQPHLTTGGEVASTMLVSNFAMTSLSIVATVSVSAATY
jgi:hypothetical protein